MSLDSKVFNSSLIVSADYDDAERTLNVQFTNGHEYELTDVPPEKWRGLKDAWSPGRFYNTELKGKY